MYWNYFILYLRPLFGDVITGCVFVADEDVIYSTLLSFYFILYNSSVSRFILYDVVWTSYCHFCISEHMTYFTFSSFVGAFTYCQGVIQQVHAVFYYLFSIGIAHHVSFDRFVDDFHKDNADKDSCGACIEKTLAFLLYFVDYVCW